MLTRLLFLLLLNSGIACQSLFAFTGEHGTVVYDQPLQSELLHRDFYYTVYLPHDYTETKLYPVLYLLHGYGGTQNDWYVHDHLDVVADSMIAEGLIPEMVIVKPRGGTWMYIDNYKNKGILYQQFFFEEFVPYFESHYSVCRDRQTRAIGGYSMGGYGSLHYGVMHHDMFCYVYAMSSVIYGSDIPDLSDIVDDYDPADLPDITLEVGENDYFFDQNLQFSVLLSSLGITHQSITRPGEHDWNFWSACTPKILQKVGDLFKGAESLSIDTLVAESAPAVICDIQGFRRVQVHKGLNIINGKKMIVR